MNTETKKLEIKAFSNAEILSFNISDKLKIKDIREFKLLQMVVFQTIKDLKKHDLLKCDLNELI